MSWHRISQILRLSSVVTDQGALPANPATPWVLRRVNRRYRAAVAERLAEAHLGGMPRPAYWVLMALATGSRDATQLVEAMGVTKQAVSKVVEPLVTHGFVRRQPNVADRRRTDLVLTAKGTRAVGVIRSAVRSAELAFVAEVGEAAWQTTVATLATLARKET